MSRNPPQTLSVKRKRNEAPVDSLIVERTEKRLKSVGFPLGGQASKQSSESANDAKDASVVYRRIQTPSSRLPQPSPTPATQLPRRYHVERTTGQRIIVEDRPDVKSTNGGQPHTPSAQPVAKQPVPEIVIEDNQRARKRPGPGAALHPTAAARARDVSRTRPTNEPSEEVLRQFEAFSDMVEKEESGTPIKSPSKTVKPKAPKLRYRDRQPEKASTLSAKHPEAMEVDNEEYVYDTYVREIILPDADGKMPKPQGTVGFIVIGEEDEEWWNGDDESDREFDTDDEDENAEDYYANDYPEDELSSDDEFGRDPYKYRGEDGDEEYDLGDDDAESGDEKAPFRQTVPVPLPIKPPKSPGYWGRQGE
jgi:hypothetical protein